MSAQVRALESSVADKMADKKGSKAPVGSGGRFAALKKTLASRPGVTNPGALAAYIGRKKYGASKMASMAAKGR
jgi:hypothetical protein